MKLKHMLRSRENFFVGRNIVRQDADIKLDGKAIFADDIEFEGMLYCATVRSPFPKIKINSIKYIGNDESFVCLITHKDITAQKYWHLVDKDYPFLAIDTAEFHSQAIALIVSKDKYKIEKILKEVKIDYNKLPYNEDMIKAFEKGEYFSNYFIKKGNPHKELSKCKYIVEGDFETGYQMHCYLEPQSAVAIYNLDGTITVYSSTQCPFYVLDAVCSITGLPSTKVKVIQTVIGGGFGGKEDVPALVAAHAAIASYITKRPVKLTYNRKEDFLSMSRRHPSRSRVIYGCDEKGKLKCCIVRYILDGGAYSTLSPIVLWRGSVHAAGPYHIENVFIESYAVKTNKPPCGAFRGFGQPQISFAQESLIDDLANKVGIEPIKFRLINALDKGRLTATSQVIRSSIGLKECIKWVYGKTKNKDLKLNKSSNIKHGIGFSATYYGVGLGAKGKYLDRAEASVSIAQDASVRINIGNTEMGQGAFTVISQIAAQMLNCPVNYIYVENVDTSKISDSGPTVASRTTIMSGNAVIEACRTLRKNLILTASKILSSKKILLYDGIFKSSNKSISFKDVVKECWLSKLKMSDRGWYIAPQTSFKIENGQGDAYEVYSYAATACEVEVDVLTGVVRVKNIYAALDCGKVINPTLALVQACGGLLQGIGFAIYENLCVQNGIIKNPDLSDYAVPTSIDVPNYNIKFFEKKYNRGPYGAKGLGELPLIGVAGAVRNAIKNACGVRINSLPIIPEKIYEKIYGGKL
ncbi:MAG: xanthine dehydrogenase family protein molybdopterin-binding subunit [Elusimicrobiales bacterium]|nr:xanthine dehydrogenase family protein molybdopterin-binding subunit [Elusimicrobiales bacterium]